MVDGRGTPPDLRPLGVGEVLDVALKLFFRNARTLFLAVAVVVVPVHLLLVPVVTSGVPSEGLLFGPDAGSTGASPEDGAAQVAATLVSAVISFLAISVATAAAYKAVSDAYLGVRSDWRSSVAFAWRRFGPVLWVTILSSLLLLLLTVVLLVPGIGAVAALAATAPTIVAVTVGGVVLLLLLLPVVWLYILWSVSVPALLMEDTRGARALGRSRRLVRGRWWGAFGTVTIALIGTTVVQAVIVGALGEAVIFGLGSGLLSVVFQQLLTAIGAVLTTPVVAAVLVVLYVDLRVRKEGFDLALLAEGLGVAPEARDEQARRDRPASGGAAGEHPGPDVAGGPSAPSAPTRP